MLTAAQRRQQWPLQFIRTSSQCPLHTFKTTLECRLFSIYSAYTNTSERVRTVYREEVFNPTPTKNEKNPASKPNLVTPKQISLRISNRAFDEDEGKPSLYPWEQKDSTTEAKRFYVSPLYSKVPDSSSTTSVSPSAALPSSSMPSSSSATEQCPSSSVSPPCKTCEESELVLKERRAKFEDEIFESLTIPTWIQKWRFTGNAVKNEIKPAIFYRHSDSEEEDIEEVDLDENMRQRLEGPREKYVMPMILDRLTQSGYLIDPNRPRRVEIVPEAGTVEAVFFSPRGYLPNERGGLVPEAMWCTPYQFPDGSSPRLVVRTKKDRENYLPPKIFERVSRLGRGTKKIIKVPECGFNDLFFKMIHAGWQYSEVVRVKMPFKKDEKLRPLLSVLEEKSGGIVVWKMSAFVGLYRGLNYNARQLRASNHTTRRVSCQDTCKVTSREITARNMARMITNEVSFPSQEIGHFPYTALLVGEYQNKTEKILDGLGPRYTAWSRPGPLPVDADLLPLILADYQPPYRLLPYGISSSLSEYELKKLKKHSRKVPPHFALGRNKNLVGLASAMVKLWERSIVAVIALKHGTINPKNEIMADELKELTGGTVLIRNREFIAIYRGKDFLSEAASAPLRERESLLMEYRQKWKTGRMLSVKSHHIEKTKPKSHHIEKTKPSRSRARPVKFMDIEERERIRLKVAKAKKPEIINMLERKLRLVQWKISKAQLTLAKVEKYLLPAKPKPKKKVEKITDEERQRLGSLGFKMKCYLLLERYGVINATVQSMHLHWKHRKLVKIISKQKTLLQAKSAARLLESESGGVLISVTKSYNGYLIIMYRGKNYSHPSHLNLKNLLGDAKERKCLGKLQDCKDLEEQIQTLTSESQRLQNYLQTYASIDDRRLEMLNEEVSIAYRFEDGESENEIIDDENYMLQSNDETADDLYILESEDEAVGELYEEYSKMEREL